MTENFQHDSLLKQKVSNKTRATIEETYFLSI